MYAVFVFGAGQSAPYSCAISEKNAMNASNWHGKFGEAMETIKLKEMENAELKSVWPRL